MKARIESLNRYFYPDLLVTCDPRNQETPLEKRFPRLIVEVLSDSTEAFDRGDKFADYQTLDSLQEKASILKERSRLCTKMWYLNNSNSRRFPSPNRRSFL